MVAAVLGMIPEGLVLLTTCGTDFGALKLAQKKTLVQELLLYRTLARVDTLCLDKTGTITEGTMCVEAVESYPPVYDEISEKISDGTGTSCQTSAGISTVTDSSAKASHCLYKLWIFLSYGFQSHDHNDL